MLRSLHTMDSSTPTTPHSHRSKPRLDTHNSPTLTPPSRRKSPIYIHSPKPISLQDLLLLSPSPHRKPRPRPIVVVDESLDMAAAVTPCRKGKNRAAGASPRNARRARRRLEKDIVREDRELVPLVDDVGRARKRKQSRGKNSLKELGFVSSLPSSSLMPKIPSDDGHRSVNGLWELISELVMWKNVAKSTLWFGFGTIFFMSSCFSRDYSFSIISTVSHLGILILGLAFFYDSLPQRQQQKPKGASFQLTEEDILRAVRVILPMANAVLAKSQEVFSGEPLMTLKVAPILLFMAKYGHMITLWRLLATGFFLSFTLPKLYSCYSEKICRRVEEKRNYVWEAWKSCPRKKFVAASTATVLWNLFSVKMRIFAAFISVVVLRYHHQQHIGGECGENESREGEQQQAIIVEDQELHVEQLELVATS